MHDIDETKWLASHFHITCPDQSGCGSSDAFCVDIHGNGKCFSCGKTFPGYLHTDGTEQVVARNKMQDKQLEGTIEALPARGITKDTCEVYNYYTSTDRTKEFAQLPEGQKVRKLAPKGFFSIGHIPQGTMFGADIFEQSDRKTLVITEGEIDAMTAHQMFEVPAISPIGGAKAMASAIEKNLEFITSFSQVILAGDADKPGQEAMDEVLKILSPRVAVAKMSYPDGVKDLNDGYVQGLEIELYSLFSELKFSKVDATPDKPRVVDSFVYVVEDDDYEYLQAGEPVTRVPKSDIEINLAGVFGLPQKQAKELAIQLRLVTHPTRCERRMSLPHHKSGPAEVMGVKTLVKCAFSTPKPRKGTPTRLLQFFDEIFGNQKVHVLNWLSYYFKSCVAKDMKPGQALYLAGDQGAGKNLFHDKILAALVGEGVDASMLISSDFNGLVFKAPYATIADKFAGLTDRQRQQLTSKVKDLVANNTVTINPKFGRQYVAHWAGRVILSLNLGSESASALPMAEPEDKDKYSMIYCTKGDMVTRFTRDMWTRIVEEEKGYLADYLLKWEVPDNMIDNRFGVKAYHNPLLLEEIEDRAPERPYAAVVQEYLRASKQEQFKGQASELFDLVKRFDDARPEHMRLLPLNMNVKGFGTKLTSLSQKYWWIQKARRTSGIEYTVKIDDKEIDIQ